MAVPQPRNVVGRKVAPTPVVIVPSERKAGVTRLGTPTAFIMLFGLLLVYYALRGWDAKYGTFNGAFAGKGAVPTGTKARYTTAPQPTGQLP